MSRLAVLAGAALLGALALSGCARGDGTGAPAAPAAIPPGAFVLAGVVREPGGFPIGGVPVQVFASARPLAADPRLDRQGLFPLAETTTAADGTYRLSFFIQAGPGVRYYLNFYLPGRFDEVRYVRPPRTDFTRMVTPGGHWVHDLLIPFHGGWEKVQQVLKAHSKDSDKARIIRGYGIAEEVRVKAGEAGVEVWWYYGRGKSFTFRGDALEGETTFNPVLK
ncbi:MAG: hypothetical protein A3J27_05885 [Candidatus Tectomicrobia bacterium RIFCSPLOWO2_12_FULL_69_37]|nr:MAG: hypothetical protein A3I72_07580 [Candidatus Tectomicrobia bacterium RIFCSPLOWO2_02_FULL_70_19]OGL64027.1 MAG: hypothetical protein A3J27_05885 [Candidatus Tectomicrobia bacterium RIFCSPLOWO2_12_FULL_69_37]